MLQTTDPAIWVVRSIAHEIRQPLSTIESIAYYLSLLLPREETRAHEQVNKLRQLVEQSNWILASGIQLAEGAPPSPEPIGLEELISEVASQAALADEVPLTLRFGAELAPVQLDAGQGRRLLETLFGLFRLVATEAHPIVLTTALDPGGVSIEITTNVPGYRAEGELPAGSALSLASARQMVVAHGGTFELCVDPASGIQVRLVLP